MPEDAMAAGDHVLAGILVRSTLGPETMSEALRRFARAIEMSPDFPLAYAEAINVYRGAANFGYADVAEAYRERFEGWVRAARGMAGRNPALDLGLAWIDYIGDRDAGALRRVLERRLREAPFDREVLHLCCIRYAIIGEPESALDCFRRFERLGRFSPFRFAAAAVGALASLQLGRDQAAIRLAERALSGNRDFSSPYRVLAAAQAHLGRMEEAAAAVRRIQELSPGETTSAIFDRLAYADTPGTRRFRQGLVLAGLPE